MAQASRKFDTKGYQGEQGNPYVPPGPPTPLMFEQFEGINTSTTRPGVEDKQMWWCDGFMPIGPRFLRTLYGVGTSIYTATGGNSVSLFAFGNIGSTPYCIAFLSDGSIIAINTSTLAATTIAGAGTIQNPSVQTVGVSQWGSSYILITTNQTNGYFIWDGSVFYKAGTLGPVITITNGGSGYTSAPTVSASGGSGSGATFLATVTAGVVTSIIVTNPGSGYTVGNTVTLSFSGGGGSAAAATIILMPFGISGTTLEVYSGRVWIANGPVVNYSAPGSLVNFATASGGGNFSSTDSFLKVRFTRLRQTNGFLYLIADSSVNYISGVQTSGSPATTTFTNQNADPEVGSPWGATVDVFGRNIIFGNAFGVHISYGAAVTKVSDELDGIYNTVSNFGGLYPSSAKAILFGKKVWMQLLPIVDPYTGQPVNKLLMWNGKRWWASGQDVSLSYIQHQEIDSVLTAYGTDGMSIYPLFQEPSDGFTKVVQSKLWSSPIGYHINKTTNRFWSLFQYFSATSPEIRVKIDNEIDSQEFVLQFGDIAIIWHTATDAVMNWTTNGTTPMTWRAAGVGTGIAVSQPTAEGSQHGSLLGCTIETDSADVALISAAIDTKIHDYLG